MLTYPISSGFGRAIEDLFNDSSVAWGLLGGNEGVNPLNEGARPGEIDRIAIDRARKLRATLEGYVMVMASEAEELGDEEVPRLRAEATALLVALRELMRHFPEAFIK